jgi:peptidoglycan/xylan/chitin deacetylase (PgdA/CDA1 family)
MTHRFLTTLPAAEEAAELRESRALLESITGAPVTHFAPPGGRWSSRTAEALRAAGYAAVSSSAFGFNDTRGARFAYRRLPVMRDTPDAIFDAMVLTRPARLWPAYARAGALGLARGVLGESLYGRARRLRPGN